MMSNVVNVCILTIYISYARTEISLTDTMYRTVVEHSREAMFFYQLQPEPVFSYVSPSITAITGYMPDEFYMDPRLMFTITAEPLSLTDGVQKRGHELLLAADDARKLHGAVLQFRVERFLQQSL